MTEKKEKVGTQQAVETQQVQNIKIESGGGFFQGLKSGAGCCIGVGIVITVLIVLLVILSALGRSR